MARISMGPPVITTNLELARVQQRFDGPLSQLLSTPWGDGTMVQGIVLKAQTGEQNVTAFHGLGRAAKGALIGNCTVPVYGPWKVLTVDNSRCVFMINLPTGVPADQTATLDVWVY